MGVERLRARIACVLLGVAKRLLGIKPSADIDAPCVYCNRNPDDHAVECPFLTGVYPVELHEMWPYGPALCDRCGVTLWPGDSYSHILVEDGPVPIHEITCTGCALLAEIQPTGEEN